MISTRSPLRTEPHACGVDDNACSALKSCSWPGSLQTSATGSFLVSAEGSAFKAHPHLHCVVPGGGIAPDGDSWISCRKPSFLLPVQVLGVRFRNVFLRCLREAFAAGQLRFHGEMAGLTEPAAFRNPVSASGENQMDRSRQAALRGAGTGSEVSGTERNEQFGEHSAFSPFLASSKREMSKEKFTTSFRNCLNDT